MSDFKFIIRKDNITCQTILVCYVTTMEHEENAQNLQSQNGDRINLIADCTSLER